MSGQDHLCKSLGSSRSQGLFFPKMYADAPVSRPRDGWRAKYISWIYLEPLADLRKGFEIGQVAPFDAGQGRMTDPNFTGDFPHAAL